MKYNRKYTKWIVLFAIVLTGFIAIGCFLYNVDSGTYEVLVKEWFINYQDPDAPANATVTFDGVTYTGTYHETVDFLPLPYIYHTYRGEGYYFRIVEDTGELCAFGKDRPVKGTTIVEKSHCRQLADSVVDDYFDLNEYKVEEDCYFEDGERYKIKFTYTNHKKLNKYKSVDRFSITLNEYGEVTDFTKHGAGAFEDVKRVYVNERKVKKTIREKLEEIYAGTPLTVDEFSMTEEELIRLKDGSCAILCLASVPANEGIYMVVKVGYKTN